MPRLRGLLDPDADEEGTAGPGSTAGTNRLRVRDRLFEQVYSERIEEETEIWYQQSRRKSAVLIKLEEPS